MAVRDPFLLFGICCLIALELQHLRWIWWEYWDCRGCKVKNKDCGCGKRKWQLYL